RGVPAETLLHSAPRRACAASLVLPAVGSLAKALASHGRGTARPLPQAAPGRPPCGCRARRRGTVRRLTCCVRLRPCCRRVPGSIDLVARSGRRRRDPPVHRAESEQGVALRGRDAGEPGDLQALVATLGPEGTQTGASLRVP